MSIIESSRARKKSSVGIGSALQNSQESNVIGAVSGSSCHRQSPSAPSIHAGQRPYAGPTRYQQEAHADKRLLAYAELQHRILPALFPVKSKKLKPGAIFELVKLGAERKSLSKDDRAAAVEIVRKESEEIAKSEPETLLSLKTEIEEVTLSRLVVHFEEMLTNTRLAEGDWQSFFKNNAFVLSLAFSHPVFLVQDHAYVGGATIQGGGEKIADFLFGQHFTGNLALIEIKKPSTKLLAPRPYRVDIYRPSDDVGGAFSQVLDQRFRLQTNFAAKAYESGLRDVHPYAVNCIVIAGSTPATPAEKKSLELYRNASRDVTLVTFDELLEKLKVIERLFAARHAAEGQPAVAVEERMICSLNELGTSGLVP